MTVERLGPIESVLYNCSTVQTKRGLCAVDHDAVYRHTWKKNWPVLIRDGKKYGVSCAIKFLDGGVLDLGKRGIDDADEKAECSISLAKPNPKQLSIVGQLLQVAIKGKDKVYKFDGAVLCVDAPGRHLFIIDAKDAPAAGVVDNPGNALESFPRPTAAQQYGPYAWQVLHGIGALYRPEMKETTERMVVEVIEKFPCDECSKHGMDYLKTNPIDYTSRESFARSIHKFHNAVNTKLGKAEYPWTDALCPKENTCSSCGGSTSPYIADNASLHDGIRMYSRSDCVHCQSTLAAAKTAGIQIHQVFDHDKPATPVLELVRGGKTVKSHVGALNATELKVFAK